MRDFLNEISEHAKVNEELRLQYRWRGASDSLETPQ